MPETMFPEETAQFYDDLWRSQPMASPTAGMLSGIPTGAATGVATGLGKLGELAASGVAQSYGNVVRAEQSALKLVGADFPAAEQMEKTNADELQQNVTRNADAYYKATRADPQTVGLVGQVVHNFADVATRVSIAGPEVGATLAAASEFAPTQREFEAMGIDKETAREMAAAQSVTTGLAGILPGAFGTKAAVSMASGATINLSVGAASRYNTHQILADAGYQQMADQYRVLDGQSMVVDLLLGTFFGWRHELGKPLSVFDPFGTRNIPQSVVDAGLVHLQARQAEIDLAPGIPTKPETRQAHIDSLNDAEQALISGNEMPVPRTELMSQASQSAAEMGVSLTDAIRETRQLESERRSLQDQIDAEPANAIATRVAELERDDIANLGEDVAAQKSYRRIREKTAKADVEAQRQAATDRMADVQGKLERMLGEVSRMEGGQQALRQLRQLERMERSPDYVPNPAQEAAREAAALGQREAAGRASDGLVGAAKTLSEPPQTTKQWVASIIAKEQAAKEAEQVAEPTSALARSGRQAQRAKAEAAQAIDPETQRTLETIKSAIRDNPDLHDFEITDPETGETLKANDALQQIAAQARADGDTATLHEIAAACGARSA